MTTFNQEVTPSPLLFFLHLPKTAGSTLHALLETCFYHYTFTKDLPPLSVDSLKGYIYFRGHLHYDALLQRLGRKPTTLTI